VKHRPLDLRPRGALDPRGVFNPGKG